MGNSNTSYNRDQPVIMDTNSVNNVYYTTSVTNTTGVCAYDSFLWLVCNQQYLLKRVKKWYENVAIGPLTTFTLNSIKSLQLP